MTESSENVNETMPDQGTEATDATDAPTSQPNDTQDDPTAVKDPEDWVTGGEPATGAQKSYLATLATEAGRDVPADLSKAQASEMIDELQNQSGRVGKG